MPDQGRPDPTPTIEPIGDDGLLIRLGAGVSSVLAARARAVASAVEAARSETPAIRRPIPAHATVLVPFDPLAIDLEVAIDVARAAVAAVPDGGPPSATSARPVDIDVRYGGDDGPDLHSVADLHGLTAEGVIELHAGAIYDVRFLGFAPGFAYLGGLPAELATPRRASPRERVPAGSVGIAGELSAVYPWAMPGGWQLIGRTDAVLFDPHRSEPSLLVAGATVRFVPVPRR